MPVAQYGGGQEQAHIEGQEGRQEESVSARIQPQQPRLACKHHAAQSKALLRPLICPESAAAADSPG